MSPPDGTPVTIPVEDVELEGNLLSADEAAGVVVFAHGSGSSRHSPRNAFVAEILQERGLGALLFDLLTEAEDRDRTARFDIERLTDRLLAATVWLREFEVGADRPIGYFGSSTGAAAALLAAAGRPDVAAVVSRGGRVDLAAGSLADVTAPTLLIAGGEDRDVLSWNREAVASLGGEHDLHVVEGAGHLFEGPGELVEVADVAVDWFERHLR